MLTSSNYDDSIKKVTGGRNGFGAKLTNIFSKQFTVTTADSKAGKKYSQVFRNNLSEIGEPTIVPFSKDQFDFTEVSFIPDFKKFQMKGLD
jgi:DNA topoisomerase II